jgi:predicted RNA-binding Zn ribbon-like protein
VGELAEEALTDVRAVRGRFDRIFRAPDTAATVRLVNDILAAVKPTPRLTDHDGYSWHVHYFSPGATLAEHLAADGGMALALVLVAGERERLRCCEAPGCARVLVDLSRNRSRRYCDSRTCGNRLHVAAYRARRAAAS